ncbi:MAG: hypothetical protein WCY01_05755 [Alkalispirochaeta sp.]
MRTFRPLTMVLTLLWIVLAIFLVVQRNFRDQLSSVVPLVFWAFLAISAYFLIISLVRTFRGRLDR